MLLLVMAKNGPSVIIEGQNGNYAYTNVLRDM